MLIALPCCATGLGPRGCCCAKNNEAQERLLRTVVTVKLFCLLHGWLQRCENLKNDDYETRWREQEIVTTRNRK